MKCTNVLTAYHALRGVDAANAFVLPELSVRETFMCLVGSQAYSCEVMALPDLRTLTAPCGFTDAVVLISTSRSHQSSGQALSHGGSCLLVAHTSFGVDTQATLYDPAYRHSPNAQFMFVAHDQPDASKRGNSGGAGAHAETVNFGISGNYGIAGTLRPGVSAFIHLTPMPLNKATALARLAEGLTQQRHSAFGTIVQGCPKVRASDLDQST